MEKPRSSPRKMKTSLCIPRLIKASNNCSNKNKNLTPMTLLERFREAVFRLIMLSALSKATNDHHNTAGSSRVMRSYYSPADPHHSEAVADCIEFIKKKQVADNNESNCDSSASSSIDASTKLIIPVPVM